MENAYGIGITNRYSCFLRRASSDSEEDPEEALKSAESGAKPKVKSAEKENRTEKVDSQKSVSDKTVATARKGIRDSNQKGIDSAKSSNRAIPTGNDGQKVNRGPRNERPHFDKDHGPRNDRPAFDKDRGMKFTEEEREERNNRRNREEGNGNVRGDVEFGDRRGGRGGGGGGFRGDRRGAPPRGVRGAPRKREFDRQSGSDKSGVKSVDKREGGGSRNWGTYKDEIDAEISGNQTGGEETTEEKVEKEQTDEKGEEKNDNDESVSNGPAEPKLMTLEEWKALQQPRQKPVFNLRKAGEGEDQSQWQNLTLKKKEKVEQDDEEYEEEEVADEYDCPQRAGRQKQVLEIDFHFADSRRGGPPGERRGGRGRGGFDRGGPERSERGGGYERGGYDRGNGGERGIGGDRGGSERGGGGERGRGGGRGFRREGGGFRGGRGGSREDRPTRQAAPRVDDVNDFPSLG